MVVHLRIPTESDWDSIHGLTLVAIPWDIEGNKEWLAYRKRFEGRRVHYVAEDTETRTLVAYGAAEETPKEGIFHIWIVMADELLEEYGDLVYKQLIASLRDWKAKGFWAREYTSLEALLSFFTGQGMAEQERFTLEGMEELVMLTGHLEAD